MWSYKEIQMKERQMTNGEESMHTSNKNFHLYKKAKKMNNLIGKYGNKQVFHSHIKKILLQK